MTEVSYNFYELVARNNGFMKRGKYAYKICFADGKIYRCPASWLNTSVEEWEEMEVMPGNHVKL